MKKQLLKEIALLCIGLLRISPFFTLCILTQLGSIMVILHNLDQPESVLLPTWLTGETALHTALALWAASLLYLLIKSYKGLRENKFLILGCILIAFLSIGNTVCLYALTTNLQHLIYGDRITATVTQHIRKSRHQVAYHYREPRTATIQGTPFFRYRSGDTVQIAVLPNSPNTATVSQPLWVVIIHNLLILLAFCIFLFIWLVILYAHASPTQDAEKEE